MLSVPLDYVEYLFKMLKIHAKNDFNVIFPNVTEIQKEKRTD